MTSTQTLGIILFSILGACVFLALGAFFGGKTTPGKVGIFAGVLAMITVTIFAVYSAFYFLQGS